MGMRHHQLEAVTFMCSKIFLVGEGCEVAAAASGDRLSVAWLGVWDLIRRFCLTPT